MGIKYSPYVVGCKIGKQIYLNPKLKQHPELHRAILTHEKAHSNKYTKGDFLHDISNKELSGLKWKFYKFMLNNPRTFLGLLPLMKIDDNWVFDVSLSFIWMLFLIIIISIGVML